MSVEGLRDRLLYPSYKLELSIPYIIWEKLALQPHDYPPKQQWSLVKQEHACPKTLKNKEAVFCALVPCTWQLDLTY